MSTATVDGSGADQIKDRLAEEKEACAHGEDRPLASFSTVIVIYSAIVGALALLVRRSGRPLPTLDVGDIALVSVANHKVSRLVAKDPITSPIRAPFTRFQGTSGEAELA